MISRAEFSRFSAIDAMLGVDTRNGVVAGADFLKGSCEGPIDCGGSLGLSSSDGVENIWGLMERCGLGPCSRKLPALDRCVGMRTTLGSGSKRVSLASIGRMGVGKRSSRRSIGASDWILLALRVAPGLAASDAGSGFLEEDLDAVRHAAICSGNGDEDGIGSKKTNVV
ncbi:hypothetical protein N7486_004121 [Penicillium sp. IBT 16267x]|nr:hypothetical protein N7486_004121 [Penicillium sp. IBT 16267x]